MKHSRIRNRTLNWCATAVAAIVVTTSTGAISSTYKCVDDKGITHYGDTMPPQCANKPFKEISGQGTVTKTHEGPLNPEQIKAREEELAKKVEDEKRLAELKRKDAALLATYGSETEFDIFRDRTIAQISARWNTASQRSKDIDARLAKLNNEMEFYQEGKSKKSAPKEPPAQLVHELLRTQNERKVNEDAMKKMQEEIKEISAKFDNDKARWKELKLTSAQLRKQ